MRYGGGGETGEVDELGVDTDRGDQSGGLVPVDLDFSVHYFSSQRKPLDLDIHFSPLNLWMKCQFY